MLRLSTILAGLVAAAHADGPRRFLQSTTCVDGAVDATGLPCTVCDGERPQDYCNCHTDCRETGEDAKFCACPEAQACCDGRRNFREGRVRAALRAPRQDPGRGHGAHRDGVPRGNALSQTARSLPPLPPRSAVSVITLTIPLQLLDALEDGRAHRRYRCHAPCPLLELRDALGHEHRRALGHGAARGLGLH